MSNCGIWLAIGYVSVIGSVGVFTLFVYVIARWSASASSYVMLLIPLVTVSLGAVLDHEAVTWAYLVGGPMVAGLGTRGTFALCGILTLALGVVTLGKVVTSERSKRVAPSA